MALLLFTDDSDTDERFLSTARPVIGLVRRAAGAARRGRCGSGGGIPRRARSAEAW